MRYRAGARPTDSGGSGRGARDAAHEIQMAKRTGKSTSNGASARSAKKTTKKTKKASAGGSPAKGALKPTHTIGGGNARVFVGDCRDVLAGLDEVGRGSVDLVFADPPFNWARNYDEWHDKMDEGEYLGFTYDWLDLCVRALTPTGAMWVNIPDTWAAEIVCYLKGRMTREGQREPHALTLVNWCVWHYRFGQNTRGKFINSKVHALYFAKDPDKRTWNPDEILEASDRRTIYFDGRTKNKRDGMPSGLRVPMDVWSGKYVSRVQGNNKERRAYHDNQLPEVYLERVIRSTSNEGDLVLDPFLGAGTTGVLAHALGRRFIGVEYSKENAKLASERIKAGPIRLGAAKGESTAIFGPRRKGGAKGAAKRAEAAGV